MMARLGLAAVAPQQRKAVLAACACFAVISAVVGLFVLYTSPSWQPGGVPAGIYGIWVVIAVVLAGPLALLMARGWIGLPGTLGWLRAIVGAIVSLIIAAVIGGTLMLPAYGTFYAPLMVLAAILTQPLIGAFWLIGVFVAHRIIAQANTAHLTRQRLLQEQQMAALSPLSQAYFYRK